MSNVVYLLSKNIKINKPKYANFENYLKIHTDTIIQPKKSVKTDIFHDVKDRFSLKINLKNYPMSYRLKVIFFFILLIFMSVLFL